MCTYIYILQFVFYQWWYFCTICVQLITFKNIFTELNCFFLTVLTVAKIVASKQLRVINPFFKVLNMTDKILVSEALIVRQSFD